MNVKHYPDGITLIVTDNIEDIDRDYVRPYIDYAKMKRNFLAGKPVCKGYKVEFKGRVYTEGMSLKKPKANAPVVIAPETPAKAPESAPTLDMFDNTDPNAPRTTDQNSAFWGLMEKLGKLTGKTGEEMKTVVVTRALGENKGTSKLTIAEMDKVIGFVKDTIALFESHAWADGGEEEKA